MKKIAVILVSLWMLVFQTGCTRYVSSYKAGAFVHSNRSDSAFMTFSSFEGRMVFRLKSSGEGDLKYSAELGSGSAYVYYDFYGTKEELFTISGGEQTDSHGGYIEEGTVYIIVETDGICRDGEFRFSLD